MTPQIQRASIWTATNFALVSQLGGAQLAVSGGYIAGAPTVGPVGSADCTAELYDGSGTNGRLIASFTLGTAGPVCGAGAGFVNGLYINVTGTTPGTLSLSYTGVSV